MKRGLLMVLTLALIFVHTKIVLGGAYLNTNIGIGYRNEDTSNTFFFNRLIFNITDEFSNFNGIRSEIWFCPTIDDSMVSGSNSTSDIPTADNLTIVRAYYYQNIGDGTINVGYVPVPWSSWQSIALQTSPADVKMVPNSVGIRYDHQFKNELFKISAAVVNASNELSYNQTKLQTSYDYALRASYQPFSGLTCSLAIANDNYIWKPTDLSPDQYLDTKQVSDITYENKPFRAYLEYYSIDTTINGVKDPTTKNALYFEGAYSLSETFKLYAGQNSVQNSTTGWKVAGVIYALAPSTSLQGEYFVSDNNQSKLTIYLMTSL